MVVCSLLLEPFLVSGLTKGALAKLMRDGLGDVFDVIIVGAGSAGCVLANSAERRSGTPRAVCRSGAARPQSWIHVPGGFTTG